VCIFSRPGILIRIFFTPDPEPEFKHDYFFLRKNFLFSYFSWIRIHKIFDGRFRLDLILPMAILFVKSIDICKRNHFFKSYCIIFFNIIGSDSSHQVVCPWYRHRTGHYWRSCRAIPARYVWLFLFFGTVLWNRFVF
jgi:hypothetical protein